MGKKAKWYCHDCDTYGGGPPGYMKMEDHVDFAHDGFVAKMEEV